MRKSLALIVPITLAALTLGAAPATAQQQINILLFDDSSCTAWMKAANNNLIRAHYESWIRGFVSGHNYANPARQVAVGKLPGGEQLYAYLDQYCLENPNANFVGAAFRMVEQYRETTAPAKKAPTGASK